MDASAYQPEIRSSPYQSPMYSYGSSIVTLTNPDDELYKLELSLRSRIVGVDGDSQQVGRPLMNDIGVCRIIGHLQTLISRVTTMSNLDKYDLPMIMVYYADTIIVDLMTNKKVYDILEPVNTTRRSILAMCVNTGYICCRRAFEEGERRFWKGSQQDITTRVEGQQQKQGWLRSLMNMGR